ncbi:hypothetical protein [Streptomyces sp. NPDC010273]|uniref:hypothetical protein n=1 Tax=Streptomyces sp. NPDC010273 TaxID=3364829 RepID=UPI0036E9F9F6
MSSNPFADHHLIYALVLIALALALAVAGAGVTWGLGKVWAELPIVRDHTWLR